MSLAIFDLDNTLIGGDSDVLWGEFLVAKQLVDAGTYQAKNQEFYEQYKDGSLDIHAYLSFALEPLSHFTADELSVLHAEFMTEVIEPIMLPKADELVAKHREQGDTLLIITATNRFITTPIAERLGIPNLLASEGEMENGRYTGRPTGVPCFQEGKVTRLQEWMAVNQCDMQGSYFYSDSANDIPLLSLVDHPVAVDPDSRLEQHAKDQAFPIISLR